MKISRLVIGIVLFLVILGIVYVLHLSFFRVDVVFYSAIFDGFLSSILAILLIWKIKYFACFNPFEKIQMAFIFMLLGYVLAISVPTVIDRSLSFYILEKLQQRGGGIKQENMKDVFINEYMVEHRLVDVRLTEQLSSGTIEIKNGCVMLTKKGDNLAKISRFFRKNLLPKKRLLMGEYTNDLTDPFARESTNNDLITNYTCKE
ncbi:MAG TPA: hypothetical protein ENN12_00275 [Epsilonproteobacteria bacterium]|nr:hypothetical protein [Campylobacterota bacterium]